MRYSKDIKNFLVILFCLSFFSANLVHGLNGTEKKLFEAIRDQDFTRVKEAILTTNWLQGISGKFTADLNTVWDQPTRGLINQGDTPLMTAVRCFQKLDKNKAFKIFKEILNAKHENKWRVVLKSTDNALGTTAKKNSQAYRDLINEIKKIKLKKLFDAILSLEDIEKMIKKETILGERIGPIIVDLNGVNAQNLVPGYDETDTPALVAAKFGNFDAARLIFNAKNTDGSYRVDRSTDQSKQAIALIKKHFEDLYTKELFEAIKNKQDISEILKKEFTLCDDIEPFRADLNRKNDLVVGVEVKTPLFLAAATEKGSAEMVQALIDAKSDKGEALIKMNVPENVEALHKVVETGSEEMQKAILTEKSLAPAFSAIVRQKIAAIEGDGASDAAKKKYQAFLEHCKSDLEVSLEGLQKKLGALKEKLKVLAGTLGELKTSLGAAL